jgi:hypothetical protein
MKKGITDKLPNIGYSGRRFAPLLNQPVGMLTKD